MLSYQDQEINNLCIENKRDRSIPLHKAIGFHGPTKLISTAFSKTHPTSPSIVSARSASHCNASTVHDAVRCQIRQADRQACTSLLPVIDFPSLLDKPKQSVGRSIDRSQPPPGMPFRFGWECLRAKKIQRTLCPPKLRRPAKRSGVDHQARPRPATRGLLASTLLLPEPFPSPRPFDS